MVGASRGLRRSCWGGAGAGVVMVGRQWWRARANVVLMWSCWGGGGDELMQGCVGGVAVVGRRCSTDGDRLVSYWWGVGAAWYWRGTGGVAVVGLRCSTGGGKLVWYWREAVLTKKLEAHSNCTHSYPPNRPDF